MTEEQQEQEHENKRIRPVERALGQKTAKHPKVRPFLEYFPQSPPKVQENKVF